MARLANLVRVLSSTTGTGTITLGSAVQGFLTPAQAGMTTGETYCYAIEGSYVAAGDEQVASAREVGTGVWTSASNTLTRSVLNSTNSNALLNLTGDQQVIITFISGTPLAVADGGTGQTTEAEALGEMIQALTQDTAPDQTADFLTTYDASADTGKKVTIHDMVEGKQTIWVPASAMYSSNLGIDATPGLFISATSAQPWPTWDFEGAGGGDLIFFNIAMPKNWDEGQISFVPVWTAESGSGSVFWQLLAHAFSNDDTMDGAFGGIGSSTDTLLATRDMHFGPESSLFTIGGSPAEGDIVAFQVYRDSANAADTLNADARLIGMKVLYSTNAVNDN